MIKNIIIAILLIAVIAEGAYILKLRPLSKAGFSQSTYQRGFPPAGPNAKGAAKPVIFSKGMDLKTTPLFKYAYQIAPGDLSADAKNALVGWNITSTTQNDGSIIVSLSPKDSEDQSQQFTVKPGETLYFIEQTPADDKADSDKDLNYRDDYGIIVDKNGIIL